MSCMPPPHARDRSRQPRGDPHLSQHNAKAEEPKNQRIKKKTERRGGGSALDSFPHKGAAGARIGSATKLVPVSKMQYQNASGGGDQERGRGEPPAHHSARRLWKPVSPPPPGPAPSQSRTLGAR